MKNFLALFLFICFNAFFYAQNLFAQPPNDECVNAIDISVAFQGAFGSTTFNGPFDNTGATPGANDPPEPGENEVTTTDTTPPIGPFCTSETDGNLFGDTADFWENSVWYTWTVPDLNGDGSPVAYSIWTSDGSFGDDCGLNPNNILAGDADTQVAIYEGVCPNASTGACDHFAANEDLLTSPPWISGWLTLEFTPGVTYYMGVDSWDGVEGEFCLTVTIGGVQCGDNSCAPVESYCDCVDCQDECIFSNISAVRYDEATDGFFFSDDLTGNIFFCSEFATGNLGTNIYLGFGSPNFTDCAGQNNGINITLSNGSFPGITPNGNGTYTMPTGSLNYIELTPADIAAGSITITGAVADGIGNICSETITINYADFPQVINPYCVLSCFAGGIDESLLTNGLSVCEDGEISLCTNGLEDLTLPCDGGTYGYYWRVYVNPYGDWVDVSGWIELGACPTVPASDLFIDTDGSLPPYFTAGMQIQADPYGTGNPLPILIEAAALCLAVDGSIIDGCVATNGPDFLTDVNGTNRTVIMVNYYPAGDANCDATEIQGCTDMAACNYDATATVSDGSCLFNDCIGICGGIAIPGAPCDDNDPDTINDAYDANCTCQGIIQPPCNANSGVPVAPLTEFDQCGQNAGDLIIQSYTEQPGGTTDFALIVTYLDPNVTSNSTWDAPIQGISQDGTFDFCGLPLGQYCFHTFSYNQAELDIITNNPTIQAILPCLAGNESLEEVLDCTNLTLGFSSIDAAIDSVIGVIVPVIIPEFIPPNEPPCYSVIPEGMEYCIDLTCSDFTSPCFSNDQIVGCTNNTACNFDPSATVDDGSCLVNDCEGTCGGSATSGTACVDTNGNSGIYDANCNCDIDGVLGCTDASACNFNVDATIDDGSCLFNDCDGVCGGAALPDTVCTDADGNQSVYAADCSCPVCDEEITGSIVVSDPDCDVSGINITIMALDGTSITITTDIDGNFIVPGGPFPCGTYTAAFENISNLPSCYSETGSTEPILFELDGEESGVDVAFFSNPIIPTLSQWGLIVLALLLMNFGAISLLYERLKEISYK